MADPEATRVRRLTARSFATRRPGRCSRERAEYIGIDDQQRRGVPRPDRRPHRGAGDRPGRDGRGAPGLQAGGRAAVRPLEDQAPVDAAARAAGAGDPAADRVTYTWVPRERNKHADRLANEALDAAARGRDVVRVDQQRSARGDSPGRAVRRRGRGRAAAETASSVGTSVSARRRRPCCCGTARPRTRSRKLFSGSRWRGPAARRRAVARRRRLRRRR